MRLLASIHGNTGYVDIPVEDDVPNPFVTNYGNNPRLWALEMEITDSPDWEVGSKPTMVFRRSEIQVLEES